MDFFVSDAQPWGNMDSAIPKYELYPPPPQTSLAEPAYDRFAQTKISAHPNRSARLFCDGCVDVVRHHASRPGRCHQQLNHILESTYAIRILLPSITTNFRSRAKTADSRNRRMGSTTNQREP